MELRQIRYFVAVAKELHFRRAAAQLGMAQPPLSQAIARLEESLGTPLFVRGKRQVALTPAGKILLDEGQRLLAQAEASERLVRRVGTGETGRLRVGFVPWSVMRVLPRAMREFRKKWPGVEIRLDEQISLSQVESLRAGQLDLGILDRHATETRGLSLETIERSRMAAVVPARWPLAKRKSLRLTDLAGHPFVLFPHHWRPDVNHAFDAACRRAGFQPEVAQTVRQPYTMFNLVANEFGIGLIQDSPGMMKVAGVKLVPIADLPDLFNVEIALAWLPAGRGAALDGLIESLRRQGGR